MWEWFGLVSSLPLLQHQINSWLVPPFSRLRRSGRRQSPISSKAPKRGSRGTLWRRLPRRWFRLRHVRRWRSIGWPLHATNWAFSRLRALHDGRRKSRREIQFQPLQSNFSFTRALAALSPAFLAAKTGEKSFTEGGAKSCRGWDRQSPAWSDSQDRWKFVTFEYIPLTCLDVIKI